MSLAMMGAAGLGLQAMGGVFSGLTSYYTAKAQAAYQQAAAKQQYLNASFQAEIEEYNAAKTAEAGGLAEYEQYRQQNSHRETMKAQIVGNGVALEGSAITLLTEQAKADAQNNYYLREQYANQYQQHMINAMSIMSEAKANLASGYASASMTKAAGRANLASSILGTASNVGMGAYTLYGRNA